ncbi:MAG: acetylglutamate kinase [Clostridia bacterium]|nr:acetylglutamate kinase [Clostridia bacterium]
MTEKRVPNKDRARILAHSLPYIRKYAGKVVVVKYGGNAMTDDNLKREVMQDIALINTVGVKTVVVHGGGPELTELLKKMGKESRFVNGLRVTDSDVIDAAQMVLAGKINKSLVNLLQSFGSKCMGISGIDSGLLEARIKDPELGYVGELVNVNIEPVMDLLDKGYIPVISSLACDKDRNVYNVNADTAAAGIAAAAKAENMIMMTDISGILRDRDDPDSLIPELTVRQAAELREQGIISGGMIPKVECCVNAVNAGVESVVILDGRVPHAILMEMLTDEGAGTLVHKE